MTQPLRAWPATVAAFILTTSLAVTLGSVPTARAASTAKPATDAKPAAAVAALSEDDKTLYALGVLISRNLDSFQLSSAEFKIVASGLADGYNHHAGLDAETYSPKVQALQRTRVAMIEAHEKEVGQAYLDKVAAQPGAQKTATGLVYIPLAEGQGATPARTDRVMVNYEGKLIDGKVFDSSAKHGGEPVSLSVTGVIPCWTEALQLMKVGGKARVICPSTLAYGDRGAMPTIMPGATLEFTVELVSIVPPPPAAATPPGAPGMGAPGGAAPPGAGGAAGPK